MLGIIIAIIAGVSMSVQGVFNTNLSETIGLWETNSLVQGIGLIISLIVMFFMGDGDLRALKDANKLYLLGGVLGAVITYTVMKSISSLGTTFAIGIILIAQLSAAAAIDHFGLFGGSNHNCMGIKEIIGIAIMIIGIVIFKWKK